MESELIQPGQIVTINGQVGVVVLTGKELDDDMDDHTGVWFGTTDGGLPKVFTIPTEYLAAGPLPILKH